MSKKTDNKINSDDLTIDYITIAEFFIDVITDIHDCQYEITGWKWRENSVKPSEELLQKANKDYDRCYWSFERAYDRARDVICLIDLKDEPDFPTFALSNLRNTRARIKDFLEDALLDYPDYQLNKYDDILEDLYNEMEHYHGAVDKYTHITYIRTNVNLGLCHNIDHYYELLAEKYFDGVRDENHRILEEIVRLIKQLYGFKPPKDKSDMYTSFDRWNG